VPSNGDVVDVSVTTYPASSNGNALAMLDLRDEDLVGRLDLGNGQTAQGANITSAYAQAIGSIGVRVQGAQTAATISQTLATNAKDTLVNKVGVNLDEEAARMIQYQQSYQAAAKILQVAQSIFETLLQVAG
jgi:flagellar hook-associated protein 1 FlgK